MAIPLSSVSLGATPTTTAATAAGVVLTISFSKKLFRLTVGHTRNGREEAKRAAPSSSEPSASTKKTCEGVVRVTGAGVDVGVEALVEMMPEGGSELSSSGKTETGMGVRVRVRWW